MAIQEIKGLEGRTGAIVEVHGLPAGFEVREWDDVYIVYHNPCDSVIARHLAAHVVPTDTLVNSASNHLCPAKFSIQ